MTRRRDAPGSLSPGAEPDDDTGLHGFCTYGGPRAAPGELSPEAELKEDTSQAHGSRHGKAIGDLWTFEPSDKELHQNDNIQYFGDMFSGGRAGVSEAIADVGVSARAFDKFTPHGMPKQNMKQRVVIFSLKADIR